MSRDFSFFQPQLGFIPFSPLTSLSSFLTEHSEIPLGDNISTTPILEASTSAMSLPNLSNLDDIIPPPEGDPTISGPPLGSSTPTGNNSEGVALTDTESEGQRSNPSFSF